MVRLTDMIPRAARLQAGASAFLFGGVVTISDLLPPRVRYGYVRSVTRALFRRPICQLPAIDLPPQSTSPTGHVPKPAVTCALMTGELDVGGIGSVVELLAIGLPAAAVRPVVVSLGDGNRTARLRASGIEVVSLARRSDAGDALRDIDPDVIELHGAPEEFEAAAMESGIPIVTVLHNTEIHYSADRWRRFANVLSASTSAIAVSELVRRFHAAHVEEKLGDRIAVIPNASAAHKSSTAAERHAARARLGEVLDVSLNKAVVVCCLARYDAQKNIAGTVASFLSTVTNPDVHLVVAGDPSDWAEVRRADAIRRRSPEQARIHLLGQSDGRTLLAAADCFLLNSFFEGWPMAATEAEAMGLPLLLSDVGGARELVARCQSRSALIPNACGDPQKISDAVVARTRRRSRNQMNAQALGSAIDLMAKQLVLSPGTAEPAGDLLDVMLQEHARALLAAAAANAEGHSVLLLEKEG